MTAQNPGSEPAAGPPILLTFITIAILGGTGNEGKGLAYRWAKAGYRILIGSRTPEKAQSAAGEVLDRLGGSGLVEGTSNLEAAEAGDIVVLTVPFKAHKATLESVEPALEGKILVDVTVPLVPPVTRVEMPPAGSAAQEAQELLGPDVDVVAAFQNISHELLFTDDPIDCDVLVCGRGKRARAEVLKLVRAAGMVGWDAGPIENAVVVEGLTSVLIYLNKQHRIHSSGIRITGIPPSETD
jgi:NADPH-dependent F420 reductase